jgi:nucleoid-associated protein YgaU
MGLFSFLKNAGASLFKGKEAAEPSTAENDAAAEALRKQRVMLLKGIVESHGFEIENLHLELNPTGDMVTISGDIDSQEDKEKVILALGNVDGIGAVDDRMNVVNPAPEAVFYEVQKGDSLSKIAKAHYGNAMKYPVIFEANKPMLTDPDKIYPGQVLRIPNIEA